MIKCSECGSKDVVGFVEICYHGNPENEGRSTANAFRCKKHLRCEPDEDCDCMSHKKVKE